MTLTEIAPKLLPLFRAHHLWFHAAHHAASGSAFYGDHAAYGEVYAAFDGWFDAATELLIPVAGIAIADPSKLSPAVFGILGKLPKPTALTGDELAKAADAALTAAETEVAGYVAALADADIAVDDFLRGVCQDLRRMRYKSGRRVA